MTVVLQSQSYVLGSAEQCSKFYQYLLPSEGTTENVWANCRFGDLSNSHLHLASICAMVQALSIFTINHNLCKGCALPVGLSNNSANTLQKDCCFCEKFT